MSKSKDIAQHFCDGYSCSQAILSGYAEHFGLEQGMALKLSSGLGGGLGRTAGTCGAVSGSALVIGLQQGSEVPGDKDAKEQTYSTVQQFIGRFEEQFGSSLCRELLQNDISTEEGYAKAKEEGVFKSVCPRVVEGAAELLEEIMGN